ncbi:IS1182 family transposase [Planococcus alpniumensis]|uniref:IS1182 family transposase n=1 Tax=Planococcus alpniumensis TaxID=2708345 RepID=UPI00201379C2|nr:IS1182 family transposase [Planococcus sp. MSAK28401]
MCNPKITSSNYNTEQAAFPLALGEGTGVPLSKKASPTFIPYNNQQGFAIFDIQDLVPANHVARVIDEMVELIDDELFFAHYKGGGRSSFHPKMMTKVILYAYSKKIYSSRGIEETLTEHIPSMWLAAGQQPDHRTINRFRSDHLKAMMDSLFEQMIHQLIEQNYITMEHYFLDGTKIEADANKYSFVWKKATQNFEGKLKVKIAETIQHIHELAAAEAIPLNEQVEEATPEQLEEMAEAMEEQIDAFTEALDLEDDTEKRKQLRSKRSEWKKPVKAIREDFLPRLEKYSQYHEIFGDRNSFSKTDPDATFMRMKDDHMKNGQLKAAYNVQMATENQFILYYSIHQRPTDTRCFLPHLEKLAASSLPMPKTVIADAGYGSEENYLYALGDEKEPHFDFLIPYGMYLKEKSASYKKNIKHAKNWTYLEEEDCFICPNGRRVAFKKYLNKKNASGYEQNLKIYECEDCSDCPLKALCTKAKGNRQVQWNPIYEEMKAKAKAALEDETKTQIYAQRKIDVESVFGHIKGNRSFRRFLLRGLEKVHTEFGIVALAHNLLKVAGMRRLLSVTSPINEKQTEKKKFFFSVCFILGAYGTAPAFFNCVFSSLPKLALFSCWQNELL